MYSFDVFDTLITRRTATPRGIFALMRERLCADRDRNGSYDYLINDFYELRVNSESFIRKVNLIKRIEEITLGDIYKTMAASSCLNEDQIDYLCRLEQDIELENVVGIPRNIQRVKELLSQKERVVLISDMYLPEKAIRKMLIKIDDIFRDIPLYVSSRYGVRKTTGNLYRYVQKIEKVCVEDWIHIGDDLYQDIEVPYQIGIKVEWLPKPELTEHEKKMLERYEDDEKLQLMIGAAIRAEQEHIDEEMEDSERMAFHVGCRYAGPVLYSYAEWIVEQAVKKGFKRLYFIARDGYLIKQIVDILLEWMDIGIDTHYIYGSRKAWRMPSLSEEQYNLYQLVFWSHMIRIDTLECLAETLHISLHDLYRYLPGTYAKDKKDTHISNQELECIVRRLEEDRSFKAYHLHRLEEERKSAQRYLEQELDLSDDHFAFVDISGGGMTQGCLRGLIKDQYQKPIRTFFFRMDRINLVEGSETYIFLPGYEENRLVIEMMCRAPHGQTNGYVQKQGYFVPKLDEEEVREIIAHGFYGYEKGILNLARTIAGKTEKRGQIIRTLRSVRLYMQYIALEPSKNVLDYFSSMPGSETGKSGELIEYAPKLTEHDIKEIFLRRTYEPIEIFYKGTDLGYSVLRATEEERALIEQCKREHDHTMGKLYRQKDDQIQRKLRSRYGRAAFYPVRLLEERVILYGAGRFGCDLYNRLKEDENHEVVLWVDKAALNHQQNGTKKVSDLSKIDKTSDEQIVIAVMAKELADSIRNELEDMGIKRERIFWIKPYSHPFPDGDWDMEKVG